MLLFAFALQTFDEVIRLTQSGSSSNVDMLVGDIYGGDCDAIGLKGDVIAASFGKVRCDTRTRCLPDAREPTQFGQAKFIESLWHP